MQLKIDKHGRQHIIVFEKHKDICLLYSVCINIDNSDAIAYRDAMFV